MDLEKVLGFPLEPARMDPDGTSAPPDVSALSPPSNPALVAPPVARLLDVTRIEGLEVPPATTPGMGQPPPYQPSPQLPKIMAPILSEGSLPTMPGGWPAKGSRAPRPSIPTLPGSGVAPSGTATPASAAANDTTVTTLSATAVERAARWRAALARTTAILGRHSLLLALGGALSGFVLALLGALWLRPSAPEHAPAPVWLSTDSAATNTRGAAAARAHCVPARPAVRIAVGVAPSFPLEAASGPSGVEVLIGSSLGNGVALGLKLNATNFETTELLREDGARELLGVVPMTSGNADSFGVDRASVGGYRQWRSLPERPGWGLARSNAALSLVERASRRAVPLWPLTASEEISRPRLARRDADQLGVVLRRGGSLGRLVLGWLNPRTEQRSALLELPFSGPELGLPSLAVSARRALIAAAVRASSNDPWSIELVLSETNSPPRRLSVPALELGKDHDRFAPSLSALGDERWFLQWTEGERGARHVRGLTLDAQLKPIDPPLTLSPEAESAGGGLTLAVDDGILSLFLVQHGPTYELQAVPLACQ